MARACRVSAAAVQRCRRSCSLRPASCHSRQACCAVETSGVTDACAYRRSSPITRRNSRCRCRLGPRATTHALPSGTTQPPAPAPPPAGHGYARHVACQPRQGVPCVRRKHAMWAAAVDAACGGQWQRARGKRLARGRQQRERRRYCASVDGITRAQRGDMTRLRSSKPGRAMKGADTPQQHRRCRAQGRRRLRWMQSQRQQALNACHPQ